MCFGWAPIKGLSALDPRSLHSVIFLRPMDFPGEDLTGWELAIRVLPERCFSAGFSGATAFYPNKIVNSSFVPRTVLTDFRLSGNTVHIGAWVGVKQSITLSRLNHPLARGGNLLDRVFRSKLF